MIQAPRGPCLICTANERDASTGFVLEDSHLVMEDAGAAHQGCNANVHRMNSYESGEKASSGQRLRISQKQVQLFSHDLLRSLCVLSSGLHRLEVALT